MEFSRPKYRYGWPFPSPRNVTNPGTEPRSPTLQADSLSAELQGKPKNTGVGNLSFLQRISGPRNWIGISCMAGRFFTNWAIRKPWASRETPKIQLTYAKSFCISLKFSINFSIVTIFPFRYFGIKRSFWQTVNIKSIDWGLTQFSPSVVSNSATPWTAACQASLSVTNSRSYSNSCPLSQWCHPTISSSVMPFCSGLWSSQHQGLFKWVTSLHQVAKILELQFQNQFFQWIFRTDFL